MKSSAKKSTTSVQKTAVQSVLALLRADHRLVAELFSDYKRSRIPSKKQLILERICTELTVHTQLEEELLYPAILRAMKDKRPVLQAKIEHHGIRSLIAKVQGLVPGTDEMDAAVNVMAVYVQEHVREEHQTLFEKVKASKIDTKALSTTLLARKAELLASIESMKSEIGNQSRVTNPASRAPATRVARVDGGDFTQGGGGL